jgi:outer membrane receptor protein involved in Fe transport
MEAYSQWLSDVPVIRDSSFSIHNLEQNGWFMNEPLVNDGSGRNIGVDFTYEKFLTDGYYYLLTLSLFKSRYTGGDKIERPSRYDKRYVINVLGGKEWMIGNGKILSVNGRVNFSGGDRVSPLDETASLAAKDVLYDEFSTFQSRKPDLKYVDLSVSYRINKSSYAMVWSLQMINVLARKEFEGYRYNFKTQQLDKHEELTLIPNLGFKIEW